MQISHIIGFAVVLVFSGCSRGPGVTITNHSILTLSNVVVSGSGFSERIGNIAPGTQHRLTVHPQGESGLRVEFDADGRHIDSGQQGYFEAGGYRVTATVSTNLSVAVSSDLSSY